MKDKIQLTSSQLKRFKELYDKGNGISNDELKKISKDFFPGDTNGHKKESKK